jgi:hyperosmotically inducible periplasmic protein
MKRSLYLLPAALAAAMTLAACDRGDNRTVGQKVDHAVAAAKSEAGDVKRAAKDAGATVTSGATDAMITTKVNAALAADGQLKATRIDVDTHDGRVVLTGLAPDANSRERASMLTRAVDGVVDVDNRLTVSAKG